MFLYYLQYFEFDIAVFKYFRPLNGPFWESGIGIQWVKWHMVMKLEKKAVNKTGATS